MHTLISAPSILPAASRRGFLARTGSLSAVAVAMLAGQEALAQGMAADPSKDVSILNVALGLEHEAINAYQLGAASGLLQKPVLDVAVLFQSQHKAHRDALIATIQKLGGRPVAEQSLEQYAQALQASTLKSQADVLKGVGHLTKILNNGFTSVAIDASHLDDYDNFAATRALADWLPSELGLEVEVGAPENFRPSKRLSIISAASTPGRYSPIISRYRTAASTAPMTRQRDRWRASTSHARRRSPTRSRPTAWR